MTRTHRLACGVALFVLGFGAHAQAQECTSDDDCDDGFECQGECKPRRATCDTDADCVKGLTCEQHGSDVDCAAPTPIDGGVPEPVDCGAPEPSPGECVLELIGCEKDSDCKDGLECAPIGNSTSCVEANAPPCMPGQECMPQPVSVSCTTVDAFCFPPPVACTNDDDCDSGTRCVELPDNAKEDPPPGWEDANALCLPEAFALALEGRVELEAGGGSQSADRSANNKSTDETASGKGDDVKDDGCAVSAVGTAGGRAWWLFGTAALWLRRRRGRAR